MYVKVVQIVLAQANVGKTFAEANMPFYLDSTSHLVLWDSYPSTSHFMWNAVPGELLSTFTILEKPHI